MTRSGSTRRELVDKIKAGAGEKTALSSKAAAPREDGLGRKMPGGQRGAAALMKRLGDWVLGALFIAIVPW